jgi:hypothetical protein
LAKYVLPQPDAPVLISGCSAGIDFVSNQWGTTYSRLNTAADFKNTSTKVAVSVLIRMQLANAFGGILDNRYGQATGEFSPAALIAGTHWSETDRWPGLAEVQCSVERVLFSDGTVWSSEHDAASSAPPSAAPSP